MCSIRSFQFLARAGSIALIGGLLLFSFNTPLPTIAVGEAQELKWSVPVQVSPTRVFAWFPDIAIDGKGTINIVWSGGRLGPDRRAYDTVEHVSSQDGTNWTDAIDIEALPQIGGEYSTRPTLFGDTFGILHMTFRDANIYYTNVGAGSSGSTQKWSKPILIESQGYNTSLSQEATGRLHLVYNAAVYSQTCNLCYYVFHRWSDDGGSTWSTPTTISEIGMAAAKPYIAVGAGGRIHVAWESGSSGGQGSVTSPVSVSYAFSIDHGVSWTRPQVLSSAADGDARNVALGLTGSGEPILVFLDTANSQVYYSISPDEGQTWNAPTPLLDVKSSSITGYDQYAVITDARGHVHLVLPRQAALSDGQPRIIELIHLKWDGLAWSTPDTIASYTGDVPEWPRLALQNGSKLHIVWFVRNREAVFGSETNRPQYSVWYSHALVKAPTITPRPLPTQAATKAPLPTTANPTVRSTVPTPFATRNLGPQGSALDQYRESDYLRLAAVSLIPVVALIAGVMAFRRFRQR